MAFHRHFVERTDFRTYVVTDCEAILQYSVPYDYLLLRQPKVVDRLLRTRASYWAHSFKHLLLGRIIPRQITSAAETFRPDLIFTVAGTWNWLAMMAGRLATRLKVPLVGSFNDWYDYNAIIHPMLKPFAEKTFRRFYRRCDLALCTCEGMRDALGPHRNAVVLYPAGARISKQNLPSGARPPNGRFRVGFGGNLGEWYGTMLEDLVSRAEQRRLPLEFRVFGSNPSWSPAFHLHATRNGGFRGFVPFEQLAKEFREVDCLLVLMGFDECVAHIERTSFKTKFLDYLSMERPIVVWGPEYSSAVRAAREFDSAEVCSSRSADAMLDHLGGVAKSPERQRILAENARAMYQARFNPDRIHSQLVAECLRLIDR
jgi:glycosyltransferase involved in cell wall biosynthesis